MKTSEKLIKSKALISEPATWTQRAYARDKDGVDCGSVDTGAVCFCSLGALNRTTPWAEGIWTMQMLLEEAMGMDVADFNDNSSHAEVMAAWDKAIELALYKENYAE